MLTLLRRAEDLLIQVLRLVLLAFSIFVLFGMGHWIWDHYKPKKPDIATAGASAALNWKDAPYDLKVHGRRDRPRPERPRQRRAHGKASGRPCPAS